MSTSSVELLHPFYLDTDMSMAFAASLAGGVAIKREDVERDTHESEAIRNIRGSLRLFGLLGPGGASGGVGGEQETTEAERGSTESRLVRHHTEASIFMALHDELQRAGRIGDGADPSALRAGEIVAMQIGPAVAPLRRVVDQFIRLIDVAAPMAGISGTETPTGGGTQTRQQRRQEARQFARQSAASGDDSADSLLALRRILVALQDDLDCSGMVDVVVTRDDAPSVLLTLDKRFLTDQALELMHTSRFTVVGKVTQMWPGDDEGVNLYRRSVLSLVPALAQTWAWGMFGLLGVLAGGLDVAGAEKNARAALGLSPEEGGEAAAGIDHASGPGDDAAGSGSARAPQGSDRQEPVPDAGVAPADSSSDDAPAREKQEILFSDDALAALSPWVSGPALQLLPLAVCA